MQQIQFSEYQKVQLIAGTVVSVDDIPELRKAAYRIRVDFGPGIGVRKTCSQVKDLYRPCDLIGRQVIGLVNIPPRQVGPMMSEFLLMGFYRDNGQVVLAVPDKPVPNGAQLS